MDAARAGGLGPARQPVIDQYLTDHQGNPPHVVPGDAGYRVQVHPQFVGMVHIRGADGVRVQVQAPEIRDPGKPGCVVDYYLVRGTPGREGQQHGPNPLRPRLGRPLLEEIVILGAVDVTLERHGPATRAAQSAGGHGHVIGHQVAFGIARSGEHDLVRVGHRDLSARDLDDLALRRHARKIALARSTAPGGPTIGPRSAPPCHGRARPSRWSSAVESPVSRSGGPVPTILPGPATRLG